jgi:hypothetical protein
MTSNLMLFVSGDHPWPFMLLMNVQDEDTEGLYTYRPKSDFLMMKNELPRLLVEVNSKAAGAIPADQYRMLLQGASIVRIANAHLGAYRTKKDFTMMAVYIDDHGIADRTILYQKKDDKKVR